MCKNIIYLAIMLDFKYIFIVFLHKIDKTLFFIVLIEF